jgi:hypothetical protein
VKNLKCDDPPFFFQIYTDYACASMVSRYCIVGSVGVSMGCDTFLIFESAASNGKIHFNSSIFSFNNDIDYKVISI